MSGCASTPHLRDIPARDITLVGRNYSSPDYVKGMTHRVETGAFMPFGTRTQSGQTVTAGEKASGSVVRYDVESGELRTLAWGDCAIRTASASTRTGGSSSRSTALTNAANAGSSAILTTFTRLSKAPGTAGRTTPPASASTIHVGAPAGAAVSRLSPTHSTRTRLNP